MKIRIKLSFIFLIISIIPILIFSFFYIKSAQKILRNSVGTSIENMAKEKAQVLALIIRERINETQIFSEMTEIKEAVRKSNLSYLKKNDDEIQKTIKQIDSMWIDSNGKTEIAEKILHSDLSQFLSKYQNKNSIKYAEIFVTDIKGATVAMTKTLSDYYQADEGWWKFAFDNGIGKIIIDDRGYDASAKAIAVGVVVPIKDNGEIIGIFKINYKVFSILDIVFSLDTQKNRIVCISCQYSKKYYC